ncbi:hypothetical protein B0J13DRAFT_518024 [Dactylonectria estremocensis]|uniref:Uncharacterized protein n=1 Tax=Dactylonectria estremocensis TaxID=1079267 RepID=A0A9P9FKK7_9HYPO|nr:hypothetical protein B0J13DRAFT_518024 [Dactylonectria estremocensis]
MADTQGGECGKVVSLGTRTQDPTRDPLSERPPNSLIKHGSLAVVRMQGTLHWARGQAQPGTPGACLSGTSVTVEWSATSALAPRALWRTLVGATWLNTPPRPPKTPSKPPRAPSPGLVPILPFPSISPSLHLETASPLPVSSPVSSSLPLVLPRFSSSLSHLHPSSPPLRERHNYLGAIPVALLFRVALVSAVHSFSSV